MIHILDRGIVTATRVKAVVSKAEDIKKISALKIDGAVLFAESIPVLAMPASSDREYEILKAISSSLGAVADSIYPKRVWFKLAGDERFLDTQLGAAKEVLERGYDNFDMLFPAVHNVEELERIKAKVQGFGLPQNVGVSIETPASAFLIEEMASAGAKIACINTERLGRHMLGHERKESGLHPALLKAMSQTIRQCREKKVRVGVALVNKPDYDTLEHLVRTKADVIAVPASALPLAAYYIAKAEKSLQLDFARDWRMKRRGQPSEPEPEIPQGIQPPHP